MDLLPHLSFDTEGAALGEGSIEVPARLAERFPRVRERKLRLLLPRTPRLQGCLGVAGEQIAPNINNAAKSLDIHMERMVGAFLREYLSNLSAEPVSLRVEGQAGARPPGSVQSLVNELPRSGAGYFGDNRHRRAARGWSFLHPQRPPFRYYGMLFVRRRMLQLHVLRIRDLLHALAHFRCAAQSSDEFPAAVARPSPHQA